MKKSETAKLLTFVHSIQGGEPTALEVEAWHEIIGQVEYDTAVARARTHYQQQARRLWPVDILPRRDPDAWMNQ